MTHLETKMLKQIAKLHAKAMVWDGRYSMSEIDAEAGHILESLGMDAEDLEIRAMVGCELVRHYGPVAGLL